jgi:hypothetical protein
MEIGDVWNAGLFGDISIVDVNDNEITVTANGFTEKMNKVALKKLLKEYNVTKRGASNMKAKDKKSDVKENSSDVKVKKSVVKLGGIELESSIPDVINALREEGFFDEEDVS